MKKNDPALQDIYREEAPKLPEKTAAAHPVQEQVTRELRRRWFFNLFVGLLAVGLIVGILSAVVSNYAFAPEKIAPAIQNQTYISTYTLPEDEQWIFEYRQVASQADNSATAGPKPLSTQWIKNAAYHIIMGEQALLQNDAPAAQSHLETALATFPEMTGIHRPLGTAYLKNQNLKQAAEQLQAALEKNPSIDVLNNLGVAYAGLGEYDQAEKLLQQTLRLRPDLAGTQKSLALLYRETGRTNEAVAAFEKYFRLNPRDTQQLQTYVAYLTSAGRGGDVIAFLKGVKGADPLAVHLLLAKVAAQENDADLAVQALRKVASFQTPRRTLAEMHDAAFEKIAQTEPFETLTSQLELATVSLSTNFPGPVRDEN
jgi:tetratricopeptide (TPR) repeat protein